jgi:hypothetical protein
MISGVEKNYYKILLDGVIDSIKCRVVGFESKFNENECVVLYRHKTMTRLFCFDRNGKIFTPSLYERPKYFIEEKEWRDERINTILKNKE